MGHRARGLRVKGLSNQVGGDSKGSNKIDPLTFKSANGPIEALGGSDKERSFGWSGVLPCFGVGGKGLGN
jgi:hypothetical protein